MQQFDVCRLRPATKGDRSPGLVVILQADLMDSLQTRVVAPLVGLDALPAIARMRPEFDVSGKRYRLVADRMSVLRSQDIGTVIGSLKHREWDIRRALDLVFVGV